MCLPLFNSMLVILRISLSVSGLTRKSSTFLLAYDRSLSRSSIEDERIQILTRSLTSKLRLSNISRNSHPLLVGMLISNRSNALVSFRVANSV